MAYFFYTHFQFAFMWVESGGTLEKSKNYISVVELKRLLAGLADARHICFRYRLLGEVWCNQFFHVLKVDDKYVVLANETNNQYQIILCSNVMQFEIDGRYHQFQPNFHYDVVPFENVV